MCVCVCVCVGGGGGGVVVDNRNLEIGYNCKNLWTSM